MFSSWVLFALVALLFFGLVRVASHEHKHCMQIGELQYMVAELAQHIGYLTTDPLPPSIAALLERERDRDV